MSPPPFPDHSNAPSRRSRPGLVPSRSRPHGLVRQRQQDHRLEPERSNARRWIPVGSRLDHSLVCGRPMVPQEPGSHCQFEPRWQRIDILIVRWQPTAGADFRQDCRLVPRYGSVCSGSGAAAIERAGCVSRFADAASVDEATGWSQIWGEKEKRLIYLTI